VKVKNGATVLFLGVGGMGMAPLAQWMASAGYSIVGYDDNLQEAIRLMLEEAGVQLEDFIFEDQIESFEVVVRSSAISKMHSLVLAALSKDIPVLRRGEMLAQIVDRKRLIAVVGSHGKTTTSGMIAHALSMAGESVNYILGGLFQGQVLPASSFSRDEWILVEVDESDGTIDCFSPEITVLLNIDWDHADRYASEAMLVEAFAGLLKRTRSTIIIPDHESENAALLSGCQASVSRFRSSVHFNQSNEAAALAVISNIISESEPSVLSGFPGMARRQTVLHEDEQFLLIEDYAHHPTEIKALIECLRFKASERRLVVVFQPHRYSRTKQFKSGFAEALGGADGVYLLPVYAAHEPEVLGGTVEDLQRAFDSNSPKILNARASELKCLLDELSGGPPTTLAFVGAGDIDQAAGVCAALLRSDGIIDAAWVEFLQKRVSSHCILRQDEPLAKKTTIRIGGSAKQYAEPSSLVDLRALLMAAQLFEFPIFCLGRGSNVLVPDSGFEGVVIRFSAAVWKRIILLDENRLWAGAGVRLKELCGFAAKNGLKGFEFLEGIPGAVGGSLRMNAGAMGGWIFDLVERVQYLDEAGRLQDRPQADFHFGYRKVEEISRGIALGGIFKGSVQARSEEIRERMDSYSSARKASQPREPSAGCIFKNPEGSYAGKLIDENDLKGLRVGGAEVSGVHGNFIINRGGASASDVVELIRRIRLKVKANSGYTLDPEVLLMGQSWTTVLNEEIEIQEEVNHVGP